MELTEAKSLAQGYMAQYNLSDWKVVFDNSPRRFGCCKHWEKKICLSAPLVKLNEDSDVADTILHEIAHALVGVNVGHGREWVLKCIEIGAKPERCYSKEVKTPASRYLLVCNSCGNKQKAHRRTNTSKACASCCRLYNNNKYTDRFKLVYVLNDQREAAS